jgi:hypothetical protein
MKCTLCGHEFKAEAAQRTRPSCSLFGRCERVCCPNCGHEMPAEPELVQALRRWWQKRTGPLGRARARPNT